MSDVKSDYYVYFMQDVEDFENITRPIYIGTVESSRTARPCKIWLKVGDTEIDGQSVVS